MDPLTALVAVGVAMQGVDFVGRHFFESEEQKNARVLNKLHQGQCPQSEKEWVATEKAFRALKDNEHTRELSGIFKKCQQESGQRYERYYEK